MTLRYVYAIVPSSAADAIDAARIDGIEGSAVRTLVEDPFAAVTSRVPEADYDSDALNEHVRDLDWLTPRAAAHQSVNMRMLDLADAVLPLSFGTLYRDDERVREMLREDVPARTRRLDDLTGRAEWVVTVSREVASVPEADDELRRLDDEISRSTPGKAFLLERRRTSVASAASERADADAARRAMEALSDASERTYREPVARAAGDVVALRLSVLALRTNADRVDRAIETLRDELGSSGYRVRATGPWPAYRFGALS